MAIYILSILFLLEWIKFYPRFPSIFVVNCIGAAPQFYSISQCILAFQQLTLACTCSLLGMYIDTLSKAFCLPPVRYIRPTNKASYDTPTQAWIFCNYRFDFMTLICILLLMGIVGKSAQNGLYNCILNYQMPWKDPLQFRYSFMPPTMVTAYALALVTFSGAMTAFLTARTGILQNDLQRVIAYPTCSQLRYMCGISNFAVSILYLMNHAFFKALLFLSAGSIIYAMSDLQDMRKKEDLLPHYIYKFYMSLLDCRIYISPYCL